MVCPGNEVGTEESFCPNTSVCGPHGSWRTASEQGEELLHGDAAVFVLVVLVVVYERIDAVHGAARAGLQGRAVEDVADENGRENVARAREVNGNLRIDMGEPSVGQVVVADDGRLAVDGDGGDEHRLRTDLAQLLHQLAGLLCRDALGAVGLVREVARLCVVGVAEVGHGEHFPHAVDGRRRHAVVEFALVAHDGIDEDGRPRGLLLTAVAGDEIGLLLRHDKSRRDGVEVEAQLLPYRKHPLDIVGRVQEVELAVVERVAHDGGREVVDGHSHVGENGEHGSGGHLAVAAHVVDEEYLLL